MASGYKFTALTGGGTGALDAQDGAALAEGDIAIVMVSGTLYMYQLSASSGASESSPNVIKPDTNAGTKRWIIQRMPQTNSVPIGTIVAWQGCYYTGGNNQNPQVVIGANWSALNALVSGDGWYTCNGAELNVPDSPIYNGEGRHLPNLSDDRFIMGNDSSGFSEGNNVIPGHAHTYSHTHTTGDFTLTTNEMPSHTHPIPVASSDAGSSNAIDAGTFIADTTRTSQATGGGAAHNHGITGTPANNNFSISSDQENRPKFLACQYIQKVI